MSRPQAIAALALAALTATASSGCGYTLKSDFPADVRTIAVPIWRRGTQEYRRDIEIRLTNALVKHIQSSTPYKVVDQSRADTVLTGTLESATQQILSSDPRTNRAREIQLRYTVNFIWEDLRTGENRVVRENFRVATTYIPQAPLAEDFFLGSEHAVNLLAQRIVEQLRSPW